MDFLTFGLSELDEVVEMFKDSQVYYLATKDNYKLFIDIKKNSLDIKSLSSNTDIKKFDLDKKTYYNIGELKR